MSEKQRFNKDTKNRQMAEKRRERWMSRKLLTEILEVVREKRDDANWILYQILKNESENLTYKSKIKIWNWLMREAYDVLELRPEKTKKTIITALMDAPIIPSFEEHTLYQRLDKVNEQLDEANFVIKKYVEDYGTLIETEIFEDYLKRWKIDLWNNADENNK